ncbi:MAG: hypothetical protein KKH28_01815 [Elusimicrobia bacterium]|nr:hypothetical protein [Elusimicrobiota bacterium]
MGIADDMKRLTEDIIVSHDARAKAEADRLEDFKPMMDNIRASIKDIKDHIRRRLEEFHSAHAEMSEQQKKDLARGETARMEKFKGMMGDIRNEVEKLLGECSSEMAKAKAAWQVMAGSLAKSRKGGVTPVSEAGEEVAAVAGAVEEKGKKKRRNRNS